MNKLGPECDNCPALLMVRLRHLGPDMVDKILNVGKYVLSDGECEGAQSTRNWYHCPNPVNKDAIVENRLKVIAAKYEIAEHELYMFKSENIVA